MATTFKLSDLVDNNSLFGDVGAALVGESLEDAVRKSTAGSGAAAAAEILKDLLKRPWVRHVLRTIPDSTYKVVGMVVKGVVDNQIDAMPGMDKETKLVLKHAVNPLILGLGKGASDASAARRRFGVADVDRIVDETVGGIRTADLANTPPDQRTGRIDTVATSPLLPGVHLVKTENGQVATYSDGQPVLLCRRLQEMKTLWDAMHPSTVRRQGQGRNVQNIPVQATPFPMYLNGLEDAIVLAGDDECPYCHGHGKMAKKIEVNSKTIFEHIGADGIDKILAIARAAARSTAISEIEAAGLMDEVKNVDKDVLVRALASVTVVNGVVSEEDARMFFVIVRGFGEGKLEIGEWIQLQGSRLWRQVQDPNVHTPPALLTAFSWLRRTVFSYIGLGVLGVLVWAFTFFVVTTPALGAVLMTFGFLFILVFLGLFRPLQDIMNAVLTRIPLLNAGSSEGLVRIGKEILAWFAFNSWIGGMLLFFSLPIEYRYMLFLTSLPGVVTYSILERMSNDPASSWRSRSWNAQMAVGIRRLVATTTTLLCAHAVWTVLARPTVFPAFTDWLTVRASGWIQVVEAWSGLTGMVVLTILMLFALRALHGAMNTDGQRTASTVVVGLACVLFWITFLGVKTFEAGQEAYGWASEKIEDNTSVTFTPAPTTQKASRKASPKVAPEDAAQKAFRKLCKDSSPVGRKNLGCPES